MINKNLKRFASVITVASAFVVLIDIISKESWNSTLIKIGGWLGNFCIWIWKGFILVMTYKISIWIILLSIVLFLIFLFFYSKYTDESKEPKYTYTKDFIHGLNWEWRWIQKSRGVNIQDLHGICPQCSTSLIFYESDCFTAETYKCPLCKKDIYADSSKFNVQAVILDRYNKKLDNYYNNL